LPTAASDLVIDAHIDDEIETDDETDAEIVESIDAKIVDSPFARTPPPGPAQSGLMPHWKTPWRLRQRWHETNGPCHEGEASSGSPRIARISVRSQQ